MTKYTAPSRLGSVQTELSTALKLESETLQNVNDYFVQIMKQFKIYFFWEQEKTDLKFKKDYIVTLESAAPPYGDTERAGIAATHSNMVKFEDKNSHGFKLVVAALCRYSEDASRVIRYRIHQAEEGMERERNREAMETLGCIIPIVPAPTQLAARFYHVSTATQGSQPLLDYDGQNLAMGDQRRVFTVNSLCDTAAQEVKSI
jgi:hypothetical protein